jgi:hypothetical protein
MRPEGEREPIARQPDAGPAPGPAGDLIALQRAAGNQAVARAMLLRNGDGGTATKTLAEEFDEAVKASQWSRAVTCLNRMGDAEIQAALKPVAADALDKLDAAALLAYPTADHKVRRHLVARRNPPPAGKEHTWADINDEGKVGYTAKVGSGTVEARTGVKYEDAGGGTKYDDGFSFGYKGADAGKMRWLQFIWRGSSSSTRRRARSRSATRSRPAAASTSSRPTRRSRASTPTPARTPRSTMTPATATGRPTPSRCSTCRAPRCRSWRRSSRGRRRRPR